MERGEFEFGGNLQVTEKNPKCCHLNLEGFMIMPIQRIPRYELLLKELLKLTLEEHIDRPNIEKALTMVKEICTQVVSPSRVTKDK